MTQSIKRLLGSGRINSTVTEYVLGKDLDAICKFHTHFNNDYSILTKIKEMSATELRNVLHAVHIIDLCLIFNLDNSASFLFKEVKQIVKIIKNIGHHSATSIAHITDHAYNERYRRNE